MTGTIQIAQHTTPVTTTGRTCGRAADSDADSLVGFARSGLNTRKSLPHIAGSDQ